MLHAPNIDPVAVHLGPLKIHWYGIMYLLGFLAGWALGVYRASRPDSGWKREEIGDLVFYIVLGVILGGRLAYILFYQPGFYLANPQKLIAVLDGGMSFHCGLVGVISAMALYARHTKRRFFAVADFVAPLVPAGLGFGRLGNFINQELWGKVSDVPWAMVFERTGGPSPRHPSQLYEFALEGVLLFTVVWWYSSRPRPTGSVSGLFLLCYGVFRFVIEFVRVPDEQLGYLAFNWVTMGQVLSLPMILYGAWLFFTSRSKPDAGAAT